MSDEASEAARVWLARAQGVTLDPGALDRALAGLARAQGAMTAAVERLPFEAEPSGFVKLLETLARPRGDGDGG